MSYTDTLSRVTQINQQLAGLQTAFAPPSTTSTPSPTSSPATSSSSGTPGAAMTFNSALSSAMGTSPATAALGPTAGLPGAASTMLTSGQQKFASRLATDTGLDSGVVSAWLLAEESGGAAVARPRAGPHAWRHLGDPAGGPVGAAGGDPTTAADATAGWLKGQSTIPGYGTASAGIQAILGTAGQAPAQQISALQGSGWASSGYPSLPALYQQITGA